MQKEFDYIVIGGGSAGCVLASRLSEDPTISVCLIEAGGQGDSWTVNIPAACVMSLPTKINNWAFETVLQKGLNGRKGYQPRGKCLGGSSAINAMIYIRGHRRDYDGWAENGCTGWSYDEVLPYFIRSENNHRIHNEYHGNAGPLHVSDVQTDNIFHECYIQAAKELGYPVLDDFNGKEQEGLGVYQVTHDNGERCSAARAYLFPHLHRSNLTVLTKATTHKIIIENKRAVGVLLEQSGQQCILKAHHEVLLCAGAMQSPQILMLSGIGDRAELKQVGIDTIHHLPGVGKNFHDHPDFIFGYSVKQYIGTFGVSVAGSLDMWKQITRYRKERRGMLASNFAECGGFIKSDPSLAIPNLQLHFVVALVDDHARKFHASHGLSCHVCLLNPRSRGTVKLSGKTIYDPLLIDPNFLGDERDLEDLVAGFKLTQQFMHAKSLSSVYKQDLFTSLVKTDDDIREVLRQRVDTVYHPVGSCKMGIDEMAVVDPKLRVYGIAGLRVIDASIIPSVVNGNTNAPVIMIAEKAVDLIRADHQQSKVA